MVFRGTRRSRRALGSALNKKSAFSRPVAATYRRKFAFEVLEERALLSVSQDLFNQIAPYQNALNTSINVMTSLPLIGDQLKTLEDLDTILQDSLDEITAKTQSLSSGHIQIAIPLPSIAETLPFDLGLDAFLQFSTSGGVAVAINPVLNVGFNYDLQSGSVDLIEEESNLDIGFNISLPNFQATLSFNGVLFTKAVDEGTNFAGNLKFGFDDNGTISPEFSGDANIRLGLSMSFVDPALGASFNPRFFTSLEIDWGFNTSGDGLDAPTIALRDFSLDADSFLQGFMADIVTTARKYTLRIQPLIDIFETPVPIVSAFDSDETLGDLFLRGAGVSSEQKDRFDTFLRIVKTINTIDLGSTGGAVINFGDIGFAGDARDAGGFSFDVSQIQNVIGDIFTLPELDEVQEVVESVATYTGIVSTGGFKYPIYEDPGPVLGSILTGQPATMVSYDTGRLHFDLAASVGVGIPDLLGIFLTAGITFDAQLSFGYDTAGLIKFVNDPLKRPEDLLHGFYFDNSIDTAGPPIPNVPNPKKSALYMQGFAGIEATAGVTVSGGIFADINIELASTDSSPHVHLDTMIQNLVSGAQVFSVSGQVYAGAKVELTVPNPVGPDITLFEYELSRDVLLDFNPPPPPHFEVPHTVVDVVNLHSVMLDPAKMTPGGRVTVQPFYNVTLGNTITYSADGIRVDYPNEIVFYVMRKNDVTTNYYNFVGIGGATPDRVSIEVIDPFRVFDEEGATDPTPAQTTRGVLLAGGKSAAYKYTDKPGGPDANVLLVGGYGSSTLSGGTMVFGNFIPADRIAQAKAHFGNVTGFEAATQSYINSRIDSVLLPASPAGIIGATMTSRRGGLMYGGPGNNSFFAEGPGAYEMIGGSWTNSFTISPSFEGVPATYAIDGGPFGQSKLAVRVPTNENVSFDSSTVVDKYTPSLKALAITANAGLSATAHGIKKVQIIAKPGASVTLGDTSEVAAEFAIRGGVELTFGGTNMPDVFSVTTTGPYHGLANHYSPGRPVRHTTTEPGVPPTLRLIDWGGIGFPLPDPVYAVTRTFGTNGRTQTVPFAVSNADASSLNLNAGGASDTYALTLGLGAFIDVNITDTDTSTPNALTVSMTESNLLYHKLNFTDNSIEFDYYTLSYIWSSFTEYNSYYPYTITYYMSSVHYTPTVTFSSNIAPTLRTAFAFEQVTINRPVAPQAAAYEVGGAYTTTPIPYSGLNLIIGAWDVTTNPWNLLQRGQTTIIADHRILANGGTLNVSKGTSNVWYKVLGNTGTINFSNSSNVTWVNGLNIDIYASSGTINVNEASVGLPYYPGAASANIHVGADSGSLADISGTINLTNSSGVVSLAISDYLNPGPADSWRMSSTKTIVGDLTINHAVNATGFYADAVSHYSVFTKPGSVFVYDSMPPFYFKNFNGAPLPNELFLTNTYRYGRRGQAQSEQVTVGNSPSGTLTYSAIGLPPGLSINPNTGLVTGTITAEATQSEYVVQVQVLRDGVFGRVGEMTWFITSAIEIALPDWLFVPQREGSSPSTVPITAENLLGRPVTFSATGLPPGITLNPTTGRLEGNFAPGSAQNGYYLTTISATDGSDHASVDFYWLVTGITITEPAQQFNHIGDAVDLPIQFSIASGAAGEVEVYDLPEGLTFNPTTRRITGTIGPNVSNYSHVTIQVTDGTDVGYAEFVWVTLPTGVSNYLEVQKPSNRHLHEEEGFYFYIPTRNSLELPLTYTVTGLPAGIYLAQGEGDWYIGGYPEVGSAAASPYQVAISVTDGFSTSSTSFEISISKRGTVYFPEGADFTQYNAGVAIVSTIVAATSTDGQAITYSAAGLPPGLSIDPQNGQITGYLFPGLSRPRVYDVTVTATTATGSDQVKFQWHLIGSNFGDHIATLDHPTGRITVTSPEGTRLEVALSNNAGVTTPGGVSFPLGFIDFAIYGLQPGAAADLVITGLNLSGIEDYFKYGPTPNNPAAHWYNFLFGVATDGDSAIGTGVEIVGNTLTLHLIDGGRGDDDLAMNGVIFDIGGPAIGSITTPALPGDYNGNGVVDSADYTVWRDNLGQSGVPLYSGADGNGDGKVDALDYNVWKSNFGMQLSGGGSGSGSVEAQFAAGTVSNFTESNFAAPVTPESVAVESQSVEPTLKVTGAGSSASPAAFAFDDEDRSDRSTSRRSYSTNRVAIETSDNALLAWLTTSRSVAGDSEFDASARGDCESTAPTPQTARESAFHDWSSHRRGLDRKLVGSGRR